MIPESEIIVFSISSAILNAVMYKKIINIKSKYLGDYLNNFNKKYVESLDLFSVNIDAEFNINKDDCLKKLNSTTKNFEIFIKKRLNPDGNKVSKEKIVEKIKENFFLNYFPAVHPPSILIDVPVIFLHESEVRK